MEPRLRFLVDDGELHVTFHPRLTTRQYAELALLIEHSVTKAELIAALQNWAKKQGNEVRLR